MALYYMRLPNKELDTIDKARKYIARYFPNAYEGIMKVSLTDARDYLESWTTPSLRWSDGKEHHFVGWGGTIMHSEVEIPFPFESVRIGEL